MYLTDFSSVRRQSRCTMDSGFWCNVVAFLQFLVKWHNENLQNSLKKIGSVWCKIELVCYQQAFLQAGKTGQHLSIQ